MKKGTDIILEVLKTEGVRHIFGNPGTTELSLLDALLRDGELRYVLGLQEASVVAMAEGYARATNRPAFVNLHATAGLGNGLGALSNAAYTRVPLVVTAGQQDYRHIFDDPWLSGDLVALAAPLTKWAHEVRSVDEIGPMLRRAFKDADAYPKGPVFLSLPFHFLDQETAAPVPGRSTVHVNSVAAGLDDLARELNETESADLAIIACDEISASGAMHEVVQLAESLGCDVFGAPVHDSVVFPTAHPLWICALPPVAQVIRETLGRYDKVFVIGDRGFMMLTYSGLPVPESVGLLHLSADPQTVARSFSTRCGVVGDIRTSLAALLPRLQRRDAQALEFRIREQTRARSLSTAADDERLQAGFAARPVPPETAAYAIARALPPSTMVVDEAPAITGFIRRFLRTERRLQYNFSKGGGLGWAMPAAVGIALAGGDSHVACLVGDGAAMYSPQALWTAASEKLPIVFIVVNNTEYGVLKNYLRTHYPGVDGEERFIGMDIVDPPIDYMALAGTMGLSGTRVHDAAAIKPAIEAATRRSGPSLIEIVISPSEAGPGPAEPAE